jgi:hypothetical protein
VEPHPGDCPAAQRKPHLTKACDYLQTFTVEPEAASVSCSDFARHETKLFEPIKCATHGMFGDVCTQCNLALCWEFVELCIGHRSEHARHGYHYCSSTNTAKRKKK